MANDTPNETWVGLVAYDTIGLNGPQRAAMIDLEPTLLGQELCPGVRLVRTCDSYSASNAGELLDAENVGGLWVGHHESGGLELLEVASGIAQATHVVAAGCFVQPGNRALHAVRGSKVNRRVGGQQVVLWTADGKESLLAMLDERPGKGKPSELRKGDRVWIGELVDGRFHVAAYACSADGASLVLA